MKKTLLLLSLLTLFASCQEEKKDTIQLKKIDQELYKLVKKYPNYAENTLSAQKLLQSLTTKVDSLAPNNLFDDLPLTVLRVKKNPHGKGNMIILHTPPHGYNDTLLSSLVNLNYIALIDDDNKALSITEGKNYKIHGIKIYRINEVERELITPEIYYEATPSINKDYTLKSRFNLGTFVIETDSITEVKDLKP